MNNPNLPLNGLCVIDLSRVLAGPICGAMLGDMGAEVIKIEDVENGDESRHWAPQKHGHSPVFIANNRNKQSVAINLKELQGVEILKRLVEKADILIENFGTGTMESLGLDYSTLSTLNPRLIYCSISAFGREGPRAKETGYEALMQAFSGIMSITGEEDATPVRCGVSALDIYTGTISAYAVVNAILMRQKTGIGQRIDASLFASSICMLNFQAQNYLMCDVQPKPMGSAHPSLVPYQAFRCGDDRWVFIAAGNDRLWTRFTEAIGRPDLAREKKFLKNVDRVRNRVSLIELIHKTLAHIQSQDLVERCKQNGVPVSFVNTVSEALNDPQLKYAPALRPVRHPELGDINVVGLPVSFSAVTVLPNRPAPSHGSNTSEVLTKIGITHEELVELTTQGVIYCGSSANE